MNTFTNDGLTFDVIDSGDAGTGGDTVVLLHGFPGGADTWEAVVPRLHAIGMRTLIPEQRGYSPGARPRSVSAYVLPKLVGDVVALLDQAGVRSAHIVGHDWGGAVAWSLAARHPQRVTTLNVVSTPHPRAMARSLPISAQALRSSYAVAWQTPHVPEMFMLAAGGAALRASLTRSGLPERYAERYVRAMREPGRLTAALNWYRAVPRAARIGPALRNIDVPTMYVWSSNDPALGRTAAELTARYVDGPYRFEVLEGMPHWLPEACPFELAELLVDHMLP
jgi:pimeloyl-ACP methyl ester carboxylesterase